VDPAPDRVRGVCFIRVADGFARGQMIQHRQRLAGPLILAALIAACAALAGCGGSSGSATATGLPHFTGGDAVPAKAPPPIHLTDYRGHSVDLSSLKGRPVLVAFLYTHCHDLCPIVASKVHTAYSLLPPHTKRPLFLAVSVDPEHDTPASAEAFNRRHLTNGEIDWLLGSRPELERVWKAWGVLPQRNKKDPEVIEHSAEIYGVGADGMIHVLYPPSFKPAGLAHDIPILASL
jgi:protein SCO1/2